MLLKTVDERGFIFFTNYDMPQGQGSWRKIPMPR
ncbi:MAG: hypothetical protein WDN00_09370 [Limisphaerales bacterium]